MELGRDRVDLTTRSEEAGAAHTRGRARRTHLRDALVNRDDFGRQNLADVLLEPHGKLQHGS